MVECRIRLPTFYYIYIDLQKDKLGCCAKKCLVDADADRSLETRRTSYPLLWGVHTPAIWLACTTDGAGTMYGLPLLDNFN
jgi:hypothetical protein